MENLFHIFIATAFFMNALTMLCGLVKQFELTGIDFEGVLLFTLIGILTMFYLFALVFFLGEMI